MKIIAVDSFTLNSGDLSWDSINALGDLELHKRTDTAELIQRCLQADVILTNKVSFDEETIAQLPKLRLLCVTATGYNIVDIDAARKRGICVCNVPDYGTDSVAQHTFALILELANRVGQHSESVQKGQWVACRDFSYSLTPLIELKDKILGLIGFGSIGQKTAEIARAFGMQVLYHTPNKKNTSLAEYCDLSEIFEKSDFVSLHLPLKSDNGNFVNRGLLSKMKKTAFLINTSRGQLINEKDLGDALNSKSIAGAAVDVLSTEPPESNNPLLNSANCIITPHNAWMSREARQRIMDITAENIKSFLEGNAINKVN
jgi:glycerate dehydrogenase